MAGRMVCCNMGTIWLSRNDVDFNAAALDVAWVVDSIKLKTCMEMALGKERFV